MSPLDTSKSTRTRPANNYLKAALGTSALTAARLKDTFLSRKYRRIAARRGPKKALIAIEHVILTAVWTMLTNGEVYADAGAARPVALLSLSGITTTYSENCSARVQSRGCRPDAHVVPFSKPES